MDNFDYDAMAELYPSRRYAKSSQAKYRRFGNAAEAIRYMIEEMPGSWLAGSYLEVNEERYEGDAIRALYDGSSYPLRRASAA